MERRWTTPEETLAHAAEVVGTPLPRLLERTSRALRGLVPHTVAAQLSETSAYAPRQAVGSDGELAGRITGRELGELSVHVRVGIPWQGEAVLGGAARPVLGVASAPRGAGGALLALTGIGEAPVPDGVRETVQGVWDLVTAHAYQLSAEAYSEYAAVSRAAAAARAHSIDEMTDAVTTSLSGLLRVLRSGALDDTAARGAATELAVEALSSLRTMPYWNRELSEESADDAFHRLTRELRPLLRDGRRGRNGPAGQAGRAAPVRLGLRPPGTSRHVPSDTAHTARAAVRGAVLAMLEQDGLERLHIGWWLEDHTLRAAVRDDGPGHLGAESVAGHLSERVTGLGGTLELDAVPGWGTTFTVVLPLCAPGRQGATGPASEGLNELHPRELHVLEQLALGRRNREIASALGISESTVKFHVSNILSKLGVSTRGEAAALTRAWAR
ncbi:LuxR C-terminal-related transcriptional regulator [Streptomyces sp. NBC_01187]|uniref:helix-turn-helix transcriptional regulator n=1 Tax=Streptomyces sp. NBC_01187 TaxID=2903766 RepID=UPI003867B8D8